jgi:hypothetical protein
LRASVCSCASAPRLSGSWPDSCACARHGKRASVWHV